MGATFQNSNHIATPPMFNSHHPKNVLSNLGNEIKYIMGV